MFSSCLEWKVPWPLFSARWPLVATKTVKLDPGKIPYPVVAARVVLNDNMSRLHK